MASPQSNVETYEQLLLSGWEDVYRKSQLSLLLLLALKDGPKKFLEVKSFMSFASQGLQQSDDQSIYRSLRRLAKADMIDFTEAPSESGPKIKIYSLTATGYQVLQQFLQRNIIQFLYNPKIRKLIERVDNVSGTH